MISSLALSEASSISSANDGAGTVISGPIANFTNFMSSMSSLHYSSTLNTQFDWSSQSVSMMAHYYNLIFALSPEDKLQLIDFMGNCYLHEFTDTSTTTTSITTTFYQTFSRSGTDVGYFTEPIKVPTAMAELQTTEIVTGHVTSPPSDELSAYRNYKFGDGSFFRECFKFGANFNLISWSIVDTDDSTGLSGEATGSAGDGPTNVVETTASVYPSDVHPVWPTAVDVVSVSAIVETGTDSSSVKVTGSPSPSLSIQGENVYTITLAQGTVATPNE
ncbi:unnamed protein product [Ambrosiozyma monospora]|uniref:Unnamed protein product n=1 Tax=Ambrosiozyma monospora TaxID=43982 RepID=A0A9W6WCK6_AMBMO|nr:unnamed protein product [Ambrosiozyma monospora]